MLDDIGARAVENMVAWWSAVALGRGGVVERTDDLVLIDGLGTNPVMNRAIVTNAHVDAATAGVAATRFFGARPGGVIGVLDPFGAVDLGGRSGFDGPVVLPEMVFAPSSSAPPPTLPECTEVHDDATLTDFDAVVRQGFDFVPWGDEPIIPAAALTDAARLFVAYADGVPTACAAGFDHGGVTGVYLVATLAAARGRGLGSAVSWAATLAFGDQPATLQASAMGRPVYDRMGYETTREMRLWISERRYPSDAK